MPDAWTLLKDLVSAGIGASWHTAAPENSPEYTDRHGAEERKKNMTKTIQDYQKEIRLLKSKNDYQAQVIHEIKNSLNKARKEGYEAALKLQDVLLELQSTENMLRELSERVKGDCKFCLHFDGMPTGMNNEACRKCFRAWPATWRPDCFELKIKRMPVDPDIKKRLSELENKGLGIAELVDKIIEEMRGEAK